MTANELHIKFSHEYKLNKWPDTYEVDAETYGNVCHAILNSAVKIRKNSSLRTAYISIGEHNGIFFHGVELIIKRQ